MREPEEIADIRRTLGRQLAIRRKAAGYNQTAFAPLTGYGRSTVANVEVGRQHVSRDFWQRCDTALATDGAFVATFDGLVSQLERHRRDAALVVQADREARVQQWRRTTVSASVSDQGTPSAVGLLDGLTALRPPLDGGLQGTSATLPVLGGMTLTQTVETLLATFLDLDSQMGGDTLYAPLSLFVNRLARAVGEDGDSEAVEALGVLAQMSGWLALDGNNHGAASRYFNVAIYAAHQTDTPALAASSLAYLSLQDTYRERPRSALSLAQTALETSRGRVSPLVGSMLCTRVARAHARQHNELSCRRALDEARECFEKMGSQPEPRWISYVDAIELAAQEGACYLDLGLPTEAQTALDRAIELLGIQGTQRVRDHVHYLSRQAKTYLLERDVEQACAVANEALVVSQSIRSARVQERLAEFNRALEPFASAASARAFRERLAVAGTSL